MKKLFASVALFALAACGGGSSKSDPQTPPTSSKAAIDAWLDEGLYKQWKCQDAAHTSDPASGHPEKARICSNDKLSAHGAGEYPVGAANVKEIFDANNTRIGTTLYVKTKSGGGESFVWYGKGDLEAFGPGSDNLVKATCVDCHSEAGSSTTFGHDFVYTQVQ